MRKTFLTSIVLAALGVLMIVNAGSARADTEPGFHALTLSLAAPRVLNNLVLNTSFEQDSVWEFPVTPLTASYSTAHARTGLRSARTGAKNINQNVYSYSSTRQSITIPGSAISATLNFWLWQTTTEGTARAIPKRSEYKHADAPLSGDVQYVLVLDQMGQRLATVYWNRKNTQSWNEFSYDLLPYKGMTIFLQFGTFNDGAGGFTGMYVDDVAVFYFAPSPPPTTGLVGNGTFEQNAAWEFPQTPLPAAYATLNAHSGNRSARTGALGAGSNVYSYSSIRQGVTIPANATQVTLYFYLWQWTTESPLQQIPKRSEFERPGITMAGDVQYVLVLNASNQVIGTLYWNRKNTRAWTTFTINMTQYKGQTIKLQFGSYNDGAGGYTGMYVDDVAMFAQIP